MSDFNLKRTKCPLPNKYEAILRSSQVWLPKNHMLNTHYDVNNSSHLYKDLVTYSRISHKISISEKIQLVNPLQILANFYNITVCMKKGKYFTYYTPFKAKKEDISHNIFIQMKGTKYYVLIRR